MKSFIELMFIAATLVGSLLAGLTQYMGNHETSVYLLLSLIVMWLQKIATQLKD